MPKNNAEKTHNKKTNISPLSRRNHSLPASQRHFRKLSRLPLLVVVRVCVDVYVLPRNKRSPFSVSSGSRARCFMLCRPYVCVCVYVARNSLAVIGSVMCTQSTFAPNSLLFLFPPTRTCHQAARGWKGEKKNKGEGHSRARESGENKIDPPQPWLAPTAHPTGAVSPSDGIVCPTPLHYCVYLFVCVRAIYHLLAPDWDAGRE